MNNFKLKKMNISSLTNFLIGIPNKDANKNAEPISFSPKPNDDKIEKRMKELEKANKESSNISWNTSSIINYINWSILNIKI